MRRFRGTACVVAWLLVASPVGRCDEWLAVSTADGRRLVGKATRSDAGVVLQDGLRDVHVAAAIVTRTEPAAMPPGLPTFELNQDLVRGPKRGRIDPVVREFTLGPPDEAGVASVSLVDPKLGPLSFRMAVTRLTPVVYRLEGVEYEIVLEYQTVNLGRFAALHVAAATRPDSAESLLSAARFLRMLGDLEASRRMMDRLERLAPADPAVAEERGLQETEPWRRTLAELRRLVISGRADQARAAAERLAIPATLATAAPDVDAGLRELVEACRREAEAVATVRRRLPDTLPAAAAEPTGPQALRLARLIATDAAAVLDDPDARSLAAQAWVDAFPAPGPAADELREAITVAAATADFFLQDEAGPAPALAKRYAESRLPLAVKVAILRHARRFPRPAAAAWEKIAYKHPRSGRAFHYFVQVPTAYRPDTPAPVLVTLHGQVSDASVMKRYWGDTAERYGFVLVSPEYVYGRESGYKASREEHEAVLGAVWHAAGGLNLDMDRVYLQGHSQGGHACWDIGGCHAGAFAAVLPIIGVPQDPRLLANYLDTAVYAIDGSEDGAAPRMNREAFQMLAGLGADATYVEYPGRGHEAFGEEYAAAATWMLAHVRRCGPARLTLAPSHACDCGRRWLQIKPAGRPGRQPVVRAACDGNRITVDAAGLGGLQLLLSSDLVDFSRPVEVVVNGRAAAQVRLEPDWKLAITTCLETRDRCDVPLARLPVALR